MAEHAEDRGVVAIAFDRAFLGSEHRSVHRLFGEVDGREMDDSRIIAELIWLIEKAERKGSTTRYKLAKESGVSQAALSRLVRRKRPSLVIGTAERLASALGYELELRPIGKRERK